MNQRGPLDANEMADDKKTNRPTDRDQLAPRFACRLRRAVLTRKFFGRSSFVFLFLFFLFLLFFSLHFPVPAPPVFFLRSRTRNFACAASLHLLCLAQHQKRTFIGLSWSSESLDSLDFAPVDRV